MAQLLIFSGFGNHPPLLYYDENGALVPGQASRYPIMVSPGAGVSGVVRTAGGGVAIVGGTAPDFPTSGVGRYTLGDGAVPMQGAVTANGAATRSIAADGLGFIYGVDGKRIFRYDVSSGAAVDYLTAEPAASISAIAASGALSPRVAYYVGVGSNDIRSFNMTGNADLGVLVSGPSGRTMAANGLFCVPVSEDILAGWQNGSGDGVIEHYDQNGNLLFTYTLPGTNPQPIALTGSVNSTWPSATSPTSFWVSYYNDAAGTSSGVTVAEIELGTGSVLHSFNPENGAFEFDGSFAFIGAPPSGAGAAWPVWLQDSTFLVVVNAIGNWVNGPYQADSQIVRYDLAGRELQRFTYTPGLGAKGLAGIAASLSRTACEDDGQGRLYVAFYFDDDRMAFLAFDLKTGKQVGEIMPQPIADTAVDLAAGFVHLQNQGPSTDGSFQETDPNNPDDTTGQEEECPSDCPPAGPGGSSFDGGADGPRFVAPGGFPASYSPPSGEGDVAQALDPIDPQNLETLVEPLVSADLKVCDGTTYRLAKSTFPRVGAAPMDARVLRWADVPYPMADRFGSLPAQTWSVTLADEDGKFRGLLATGVNRFYKRWTVDVFIEDNAARLAGTERQRLYRGRCVSVRTEDDQTVTLVFSDEYSRHDSPYSLDRELPHLLIGDIFGPGASSPDLVGVPTPADEQIAGHAANIVGGECSDEYRVSDNPPVTPIGINQLFDLGDVSLGSETWAAFFGHLYASHSVPAIFGSNLDRCCPGSVRLDPALYNGDQAPQFLVPGYAPWDAYFANKYIEIQRDGVTYWVTLIFGRSDSTIVQQHRSGAVPLSANLNSPDDVGDGSGDLIDDAARLLQWFIDHPLLRKTTSGVWGDVARFDDSIAKIRTSDFEAIRLLQNARLSTRFRASVIVDTQRAGRDWLADLCVSWGIRLGLNHHGQITAHAFDTATSLTGMRTFTDLLHIREGSFKITSEISGEVENSLTVQAGPEPASGRFTVGTFPLLASDSIREWGDVYTAQPITFVGLHRADVAQAVAGQRLIQTQDGVTRGAFGVDLAGGAVRGGELIRLTHLAGIGPLGWRNRVVMATNRALVIEDEPEDQGWQTRVEFEDVHPILVAPGDDPEAPAFGFDPLDLEADDTADLLGSEIAGTALRLG